MLKLFLLFVLGKECEDIFRRGGVDSQMYMIQPDAFYPPYKVFCDQASQNGGETFLWSLLSFNGFQLRFVFFTFPF